MATKRQQLMQQRADEADRMIMDLSAPQTADSAEELNRVGAAEGEQPTIVDTEADAGQVDQGADTVDTPPQEPAVSGDELAAVQAELASAKAELVKSEQRYSTLQGMLNARNEDILALRKVIANMGELPQAAPAAPEPTKLVTDKDVEDYGEDLINLIARVTKQQVDPLLQAVDNKVATVARVATATAEQRFETELAKEVPDWEQVNESPEFVAWLGRYNTKALNEAYNAQDLQGTAQFFKDFKVLHNQTQPQQVAATATQVAPAASTEDKLAHLAAPGKSKVAPMPFDANRGKVWTSNDVTKLYQDHAARRITTAEFDKLEADLFKAQREGRIAA